MALARLSIQTKAKRGDTVPVRLVIQHPMETGFRVDSEGRPIAPTVRYRDRVAVTCMARIQYWYSRGRRAATAECRARAHTAAHPPSSSARAD